MQSDCKHGEFQGDVSVNFMQDLGRWIACLQLRCAACQMPFHFGGVPEQGVLMTAPALGPGGCEIRLPIAPGRLTPEMLQQFRVAPGDGSRVAMDVDLLGESLAKLQNAEAALETALARIGQVEKDLKLVLALGEQFGFKGGSVTISDIVNYCLYLQAERCRLHGLVVEQDAKIQTGKGVSDGAAV